MAKRKVTTIVTLEVKLKVPYKKAPGHVLQFVTSALRASEYELDTMKTPLGSPEVVSIQLVKKETTYG